MSSSVLLSLHQELKQCFEVLKVNKCVWDSALADCEPLISSIGNIAVQLKALKHVQLANTPLASFPGLHERLHYKLSLAVDTALGKLAENMWVRLDDHLMHTEVDRVHNFITRVESTDG